MSREDEFRKLSHIENPEVEQDIKDTQSEIDDYSDELDILMRNPTQNKLRIYMINGNISERESFNNNLKEMLAYRLESKRNHRTCK